MSASSKCKATGCINGKVILFTKIVDCDICGGTGVAPSGVETQEVPNTTLVSFGDELEIDGPITLSGCINKTINNKKELIQALTHTWGFRYCESITDCNSMAFSIQGKLYFKFDRAIEDVYYELTIQGYGHWRPIADLISEISSWPETKKLAQLDLEK